MSQVLHTQLRTLDYCHTGHNLQFLWLGCLIISNREAKRDIAFSTSTRHIDFVGGTQRKRAGLSVQIPAWGGGGPPILDNPDEVGQKKGR